MKCIARSRCFRRSGAAVLTGLCLAAAARGGEMRVFHSSDGKPLKASLESVAGDIVTLKREDGKMFDLPQSRLSAEDRAYIQEAGSHMDEAAKKLNAAAGHDLADAKPFSERDAADLAKALGLRLESESKQGKSWRLYAAFSRTPYQLFGTMPYSVALYSDAAGKATSLSIVYANKGDFGSTAGFARDHFKGGTESTPHSLAEAMTKDHKTITAALVSVLGPGKAERYGDTATRRNVTRWDWNGWSFILSNQEGEYVGLSVIPTSAANSGGRSALTRDADVKARLKSGVVRSENGDVYLTGIPMVDQGPKGYCVPATFERVMRAMGLEADMYLLAMIGQTAGGGGTSVELLLENLRHQVLSKGRRLKEKELKDLRIRDFKSYIDEGIPVMWTLCSMDEYNEAADKDTAKRATVTDWKEYATQLASTAEEFAKTPKPEANRHICMIVGYNEATNEIAVSDSWGPRFERRWVPLAVANWASTGRLVMILP